MGKSGKLFKAFVAGVKAFKSPSKEKAEKNRSSSKADKDHVPRKGGKEKCLWTLGKSSSRNRDSLSAAAAFLDSPEIKSVQVENSHFRDVLPISLSVASDSGNASKVIQDKSVASSRPLNHLRDVEQQELAAIKIQAAIRRYLAAQQVFRALQAVVRLQALVRGRIVRKQAATSLRCMQALVRVQALARGRRVRSSELGQLIQKHIQQTRQQRKKPVAEGWVSSTASLQQWQAKAQSKQDAVMKRQRALVYAFSEQLNRSTPKQSSSSLALDFQLDKTHWGWAWLERWMAAQPAGISHGVAKEQHNKNDTGKSRPDITLNLEEFEGSSSPLSELAENNRSTSLAGYDDVGADGDDPGNHAVQESAAALVQENVFHAMEQSVEQVKEKDEHFVFEMSAVENVSVGVVKRPQPSLPPPPPPPPPLRVRAVPKPSPSCALSPPVEVVPSPPPPVGTTSVKRAPASTPPPPPPPPPYARKANPLVAHHCSSSECQQGARPVNVCSPHTTSSAFAHDLLEGEISSTEGTHGKFPLSATPAFSDLPSLPTVSSVSSTAIIQPVIESFSAPSIPESYHESLLYPNQASPPTTSSVMSNNGMKMQDQCEKATDFTLTSNTSNFLIVTPSPSQPSATPTLSPESLALSTQHYASSRTPLIIPNVIEEDMQDGLEETGKAMNENNLALLGDPGVNRIDVTAKERVFSVDHKAGNTDQSDNNMDVDEPDEAIVHKTDGAIQVNSPEANGRNDLSGASPAEKSTEFVLNKHAVSPTSRQGQPMEAVSPSVPNYMATTKSSKAKIRTLNSPIQKSDSPKQKSESPKPRFDSSKQKADSPKPRFDSSKQKIDSPKQKLDSPKQRLDSSKQKAESSMQKAEPAVKRRHSLSTLEGKGSPGTIKPAMHSRGSSKGQLMSLRGDTSMEDAACANGHSRRIEK